jgi:hypothetical protein
MDDQDKRLDLVMPFVVCKSNGGPFDDEAFVAGCNFSKIEAFLRIMVLFGVTDFTEWVDPKLIPQLDLLAMNLGFKLDTAKVSEVCDGDHEEGVDEDWVLAMFTRASDEIPED